MDPITQINQQMGSLFMEVQRLKKRLAALEAAEKLRAVGRPPQMPIEFKSQFGEDALLWDLLGGPLDGYYIEVGAFDGYHFSVSYAFECIGWKGLLIEPIPDRYQECVQRRPRSRVVHAALSGRGAAGTAEFTVTDDEHGGMYSFLDPTTADPAKVTSAPQRKVPVPLTTINDLLADHQGEIDFASIDIEGGEVLALDGFDLARFRPKVLFIEDGIQAGSPELTRLMAGASYIDIGRLQMNRIFVRSDVAQEAERRFVF